MQGILYDEQISFEKMNAAIKSLHSDFNELVPYQVENVDFCHFFYARPGLTDKEAEREKKVEVLTSLTYKIHEVFLFADASDKVYWMDLREVRRDLANKFIR